MKYDMKSFYPYEVIDQPLYDHLTFNDVIENHSFFNLAIGKSGKTLADTNMYIPGQLPKGNQFIIEEIEVKYYGPNVDIYNDRGYLELFIGNKKYLVLAPLDRFRAKLVKEKGDLKLIGYKFSVPLLIPSNQNFCVKLHFYPKLYSGRIGVYLLGKRLLIPGRV